MNESPSPSSRPDPVRSGATPGGARRINRRLVLSTIHAGGQPSRADIAKAVGLTPATVSSVVRDLLDDELIEELAPSALRSVGKPATPLGIRADGRYTAVIDLSSRQLFVGALADLHGTIIERLEVPRRRRIGADALAAVVDMCAELVDLADRPLLGVGIASPGFVMDSRLVVESPHLAWHGTDLRTALADIVDVPVIVVNDANAGAFGQVMFGDLDGEAVDDMMYVRIDDGVGAGIVLDGRVRVGPTGGGGEIGHVVVNPEGPPCACGNQGCLEAIVAELLSSPSPSRDAVEAAGRALGAGIAGIVSTLDIDCLVIGGISAALDERFLTAVADEIVARTLPAFAERVRVSSTSLDIDDVLLGTVAVVLESELGLW